MSLDWGFHEPLLFLTRRARLLEPIWEMRDRVRSEGAWTLRGGPRDVYFVHGRGYDLFGYGPRFLAAARAAGEANPGLVEVASHTDREGAIAFWTVRLRAPHVLALQRVFDIRLEPEAASAAPEAARAPMPRAASASASASPNSRLP